jgi:hypothetical protein
MRKISSKLLAVVIFIIFVAAFAFIGDSRILPCQIKCKLNYQNEAALNIVKQIESNEYCNLHGLNILESKWGCEMKPYVYTSNILFTVFYLLMLPFIATVILMKIIKKKIKK